MKQFIKDEIERFIRNYEKNTLTSWGRPLVGFADARAIDRLKSVVSPEHGKPEDAVQNPTIIIAYFVPFLRELAQTNVGGGMASAQWAQAYEETNTMFVKLNDHLIRLLREQGYQTAVSREAGSFDHEKLISNWSQRHVAYLAGLGTFGLNNMLITENGCCGRISTVITNLDVEPDAPMSEELCIYKKTGKCGLCADRCPSGALTLQRYDRKMCYDVCLENAKLHNSYGNSYAAESGGDIIASGSEVCGKCIAGMPCAFRK